MTEAELTAEVIKLARDMGALVHHCKDSRLCDGTPGFPDVVIVGPGGVVFAELKSQYGDRTADQDNWAYWLVNTAMYMGKQKISHVYYLWRPEDLERGDIETIIKMITLN